jgi:predicted ATPase
VPLGSRAREILALLLESPGELVTTEAILARVWPGTFVADVAVRVHVAGLRKILREGAGCQIENVRGRGYRLILPSSPVSTASEASPLYGVCDLIGRSGFIATVQQRMMQERLLTLAGPGGVGKSAVALAAACELRKLGVVDVRVVDVATARGTLDSDATVAAALEDAAGSTELPGARGRSCLLVMDNCDYQGLAATMLIERALTRAPQLRILATSRQILRLGAERVLRLPPLDFPQSKGALSAAEAREFPAIDLFATRAAASGDHFELTEANASTVARICSQLDGLPLAIEFAAMSVHELGLAGLLVDGELLLDLLTRGRRTAIPSHRTLRAMLDFSYRSLSSQAQLALRRLSVFPAQFSRAQAAAVIVDEQLSGAEVDSVLEQLIAASFLEAPADKGSYRLLNIHRAYALQKLQGTREHARVVKKRWGGGPCANADCYDTTHDIAHEPWSRGQPSDTG